MFFKYIWFELLEIFGAKLDVILFWWPLFMLFMALLWWSTVASVAPDPLVPEANMWSSAKIASWDPHTRSTRWEHGWQAQGWHETFWWREMCKKMQQEKWIAMELCWWISMLRKQWKSQWTCPVLWSFVHWSCSNQASLTLLTHVDKKHWSDVPIQSRVWHACDKNPFAEGESLFRNLCIQDLLPARGTLLFFQWPLVTMWLWVPRAWFVLLT